MALLKDVDLDYKGTVEKESREKLGFEISNSTLGHAVLVQTKLIENTRSRLSIITSSPQELEYEPLISSIASLAERLATRKNRRNPLYSLFHKPRKDEVRNEIRILFSEEGDYQGNFYDFARMYDDVIKIKKFKTSQHNLFINNFELDHFLVSYSVRYREEKKHNKEDLIDYNINATANFNDKSKASILEKLFDIYWKRDDALILIQ